jgi:predicted AlkP superfamily pyrophosphatase or phosphodiesterase
MPEHVRNADAYGLKIPNLRRLLASGASAAGVRGVLPTLTYPTHVTMLTGVSPDRHGIINNYVFDPFERELGAWNWYAENIRVPTLWQKARERGLRTASVDWPVSVGAPVDLLVAQIWHAGTAEDDKLIRALSTPGLMKHIAAEEGPYAAGNDYRLTGDRRRGAYAVHLIEHEKPDFITVYLGSLDAAEHAFGPGSPEAFAVLEALDVIVGELDAALRSQGDGFLCVVSDHGFRAIHTDIHLNVALAKAGLMTIQNGKVVDWKAQMWRSGGTASVVLRNPADTETRNRVGKLLRALQKEPKNGIKAVHTQGAPAFQGGFPDAPFLVEARDGFAFLSSTPHGDFAVPADYRGSHGYPANDAAMNATFLIAGPGVPAGYDLGEITMLDIAPTLSTLLGVELPTAQGVDRLAGL